MALYNVYEYRVLIYGISVSNRYLWKQKKLALIIFICFRSLPVVMQNSPWRKESHIRAPYFDFLPFNAHKFHRILCVCWPLSLFPSYSRLPICFHFLPTQQWIAVCMRFQFKQFLISIGFFLSLLFSMDLLLRSNFCSCIDLFLAFGYIKLPKYINDIPLESNM